jgi:hypothetical protein
MTFSNEMLSSYEVSSDGLSIKYNNLILKQGTLYYTTTESISLPLVNKWKHTHVWHPTVKIIKSDSDVLDFIGLDHNVIDFALYGDILWYGSIGHALYDEFYPLFLALIRFGLENQEFTLLAPENLNKKTLFYEILTHFTKCEPINFYDTPPTLIKNLVAGNGNVGCTAITKDYTLGNIKYDGLKKFKNRIYKSFSVEELDTSNQAINISIINNKRYSNEERQVLNEIIKYYSTNNNVNIDFTDWSHFPNFYEQLKKIKEIDIHVSGPGTGMLYAPLLKNYAVNINLGYMERSQTNGARPNIYIKDCPVEDFIFPGWMEQSTCYAARHISNLFYDRYQNPTLEFSSLVSLIDNAIQLNRSKILNNELNIDAKIFVEYCKRCNNPDQVCKFLADSAFFIELFVCEHPYAVPKNIVDIELLRKIKREFNYNFNYDYTTNE